MCIKKFILILALAVPFITMADEVHPSIPVEQLPANDTTASWQDEGMVIMEDGKGFVALYNTTKGVYFQVLVKDRRLQQQFLRQGLVVYLDANGKKKKKYSVQFPTLDRPKPGEMPRMGRGERGRRGQGSEISARDTSGMFGDIRPTGPQDRKRREQSKAERARMLKMLVSQIATKPTTFCKDDEESIMAQESAKISVSDNNIVFSAFVPYDKLGKLGKKGEFAIGVTVKELETTDNFPGGGMMPPPPGMMPPPGMGGFRGRFNSLNEVKTFAEWLVFSIKNTNLAND